MPRYSPMNPKYKAKWLKALRSGQYKQIKSRLRDKRGMCCLGVLCDVVNSEEWEKAYPEFYFRGRSHIPDATVVEQTGLTKGRCAILANMNDTGSSFKDIADFIEKNF